MYNNGVITKGEINKFLDSIKVISIPICRVDLINNINILRIKN